MKKRGACWRKECSEKYTLGIRLILKNGKGSMETEIKACKNHFIQAWEHKTTGYRDLLKATLGDHFDGEKKNG